MVARTPALLCVCLCAALPHAARAESGEWNLHLEPAYARFLTPPQRDYFGAGGLVNAKADRRVLPFLALQATASAAAFSTTRFRQPGTAFGLGGGVRFRLVDDDEGYAWHLGAPDPASHRGNYFGNLFIDVNAELVATGPEVRPAAEATLGLELSLLDALQAGPFVEYFHIFDPNNAPGFRTEDAYVFAAGVSFSFTVPSTEVHEDDSPPPTPTPETIVPTDTGADTDKDGIPDEVDRCPKNAETFNGIEDSDGCPDGDSLVVITETQIEIRQPIKFDKVLHRSGEWQVQPSSYPLLAAMAKLLVLHPEVAKVWIEGHTDDLGSHDTNLTLSANRAEAVKFHLVVKLGVDPRRLETRGYASDCPVDTNATEAGRARNRRVEFFIKPPPAGCRAR